MEKTVERIKQAIKNKERIIVYGDYDVDGITATAILFQTLKELGAIVSYRLPDRQNDGYGLHKKFIEEFKEKKIKLIITVDCGISCREEIILARNVNIDVIITDHHSIPEKEKFPIEAYSIIHPKQKDCPYPDKEITGAGIALKLSQALHQRLGDLSKNEFEKYIDLAAFGTIADCAPLLNENRLIVKHGLNVLADTKNMGLKHLKKVSGIDEKAKLSPEVMSFYLAPRMNAAGRLAHPYYALQMLIEDNEKAQRLASKLEKLNMERRRLTGIALEELEAKIASNKENQEILIAWDRSWPSGIIGLLCGKIQEKYFKPCVIMEDRGEELIGSVRSPEIFSSIDLLKACDEFLMRYGGHRQAGGFHMKKNDLENFVAKAKEYTSLMMKGKSWENILKIDCEIEENDISFETIDLLETFEPFGMGNTRPLFLLKNRTISNIRTMGSENRHIHFLVGLKWGNIRAVGFNFGQYQSMLKDGMKIDIVCSIEKNEWNGAKKLELKITDIKV